jgi:hypothetical protein
VAYALGREGGDAIETDHPPLSAALLGVRKAASSPIIGELI